MKWSTPNPKFQPRKPFPHRPDRIQEPAWITKPPMRCHDSNTHWSRHWSHSHPTGCKWHISDSTRAQMIDTIVYALGTFLFVHFLPQVTVLLGIWFITNYKYQHKTNLANTYPYYPTPPPPKGGFLFSALGRGDLRGGRGMSEDLWRLYGGQVRISLSL